MYAIKKLNGLQKTDWSKKTQRPVEHKQEPGKKTTTKKTSHKQSMNI